MGQYINKSTVVAEIEKRINNLYPKRGQGIVVTKILKDHYEDLLSFIDTIEVKESDETAEAFAKIIRANLTGIDKDVQYKFEQLYKEITGGKMYQGYND